MYDLQRRAGPVSPSFTGTKSIFSQHPRHTPDVPPATQFFGPRINAPAPDPHSLDMYRMMLSNRPGGPICRCRGQERGKKTDFLLLLCKRKRGIASLPYSMINHSLTNCSLLSLCYKNTG